MWGIQGNLPIKLAVIDVENIQVTNQKTAFESLRQCAADYKFRYEGIPIGEIERVQNGRRLFRAIGIDPTKHRPASEALLNRALKVKEFYSVNTLVDVGNWCALDFLLPTCVYDGEKVVGDVAVREGVNGESYLGLNNRTVNLHKRYVIADNLGAFGSPITDSQRTATSIDTKMAILTIYAHRDYDNSLLDKQADLFAKRTIDICGGNLRSIEILY